MPPAIAAALSDLVSALLAGTQIGGPLGILIGIAAAILDGWLASLRRDQMLQNLGAAQEAARQGEAAAAAAQTARQAELDAARAHAADPTDSAFDPGVFRSDP